MVDSIVGLLAASMVQRMPMKSVYWVELMVAKKKKGDGCFA